MRSMSLTEIWALDMSEQPVVYVADGVFEVGIFELKAAVPEKCTRVVKYVDARAVPLFVALGSRDCQNLVSVPELYQAGLSVPATQVFLIRVVQVEVVRDELVDEADEWVRLDCFPHCAWYLAQWKVCHSILHVN